MKIKKHIKNPIYNNYNKKEKKENIEIKCLLFNTNVFKTRSSLFQNSNTNSNLK